MAAHRRQLCVVIGIISHRGMPLLHAYIFIYNKHKKSPETINKILYFVQIKQYQIKNTIPNLAK